VAALAAVSAVAAVAATGVSGITGGDKIETFAGKATFGLGGFSGDGGPAVKAELSGPSGVALDGQGNVYIADTRNQRVRKVSLAGTITTIAGGGPGISGSSGPATSAHFDDPIAVAVDGHGNVYVTDRSFVYRVSSAGTLTTFAGSSTNPGFSGDGGPATTAQLAQPSGIAVDGRGDVYISDTRNNRVREVSPGGTITTIAGTSVPGFSGDGGPATKAQLNQPQGVALDGHGNVYIADQFNSRVRRVAPSGTITTVAGTGKNAVDFTSGRATATPLSNPFALAVDAHGNLYVSADDRNVFKVSPQGTITTVAGLLPPHRLPKGVGDGGPATSATLAIANASGGLAFDRHGNLYIADLAEAAIREVLNGTARPVPKKPAPPVPKRSGSKKTPVGAASTLEVALGQMANGRTALQTALAGVFSCSLSPQVAAGRLATVIGNRDSVLAQLRALAAPTSQLGRIKSLLVSALEHSIAADSHYRAWLGHLRGQAHCSTAHDLTFTAAQREDKLATTAKERFVAAFNPLARKLHLRTWSALEL